MAEKRNEVSRRDFASRMGAAAAAVAAGGAAFGSEKAGAAPLVSDRVLGANDRVVVASIGIRGQGASSRTCGACSRTRTSTG